MDLEALGVGFAAGAGSSNAVDCFETVGPPVSEVVGSGVGGGKIDATAFSVSEERHAFFAGMTSRSVSLSSSELNTPSMSRSTWCEEVRGRLIGVGFVGTEVVLKSSSSLEEERWRSSFS